MPIYELSTAMHRAQNHSGLTQNELTEIVHIAEKCIDNCAYTTTKYEIQVQDFLHLNYNLRMVVNLDILLFCVLVHHGSQPFNYNYTNAH